MGGGFGASFSAILSPYEGRAEVGLGAANRDEGPADAGLGIIRSEKATAACVGVRVRVAGVYRQA